MTTTAPTTHVHIYNSGHPTSTTPTSTTDPSSTTTNTTKDATSEPASSTPLSEPQTLTAPLTLIPADALKVKATSTETKSSKKPKVKQYEPRDIKFDTDKRRYNDYDSDDTSTTACSKNATPASKAFALMRAVLRSDDVERSESESGKGKGKGSGGPMIRNGYVQEGYRLADLRCERKVGEGGRMFRTVETGVSGTVEGLEGGGRRVVFVETRREVVVVVVGGGGGGGGGRG